MLNEERQQNILLKITNILLVLYIYFSSRRGGDTRYIFSILIIISSYFWIKKEKFVKIKKNKYLYTAGLLYLICSVLSFVNNFNSKDNLLIFLCTTVYSIIYFLCALNINIQIKYQKYILPILMIFSLGSIFRGLEDILKHLNNISWYRISGGTYTTVYAMEIGIYLLFGIFSMIIWKKWYFKLIGIIYILLNSLLLIGTKSRNTMIMFPITILILIIIYNKKKGLIILLLSLILGIGIIKNSQKIPFLNRLSTISSVSKIKENARYLIYKKGIEIGNKNKLLGVGLNKYKKEGFTTNSNTRFQHFHNVFIETYVSQGILVLCSYIFFIFMLIKSFYSKLNIKKEYTYLGIGIIVFTFLYGMAESIIYFTKIYPYVFLVLSFISFIREEDIK